MTGRFVDLTDRIIYLRSIPVAAELPPPVLKIIASYLRERSFPAGSHVMREGEPIEALHLLTDGGLELVRKGKPFGKLEPPQSLGFLGILARSDGTYDATAAVDTRSLELDSETLIELIEDHGELMIAVLRYLGDRLLYEVRELEAAMLEKRYGGSGAPLDGTRADDLVERIAFLRTLAGFSRTNLNALAVIARVFDLRHFEPGERVWSAGEPPDDVVVVIDGEIQCQTEDGKEWTAGPRAFLGVLEGIAQRPHWFHVTAKTRAAAFRCRMPAIIDLFEDDFPMAMDFISLLSMELVDLLETKVALGQSTVGVKRDVSKLGAVPVGA
jgi:CRP-like cAMP-binding protein